MNLCAAREQLEQLVHGELEGTDRDEIAAHVEDCAACQHVLEQLTRDPGGEAARGANRTSAEVDQHLLDRLKADGPLLVDDDADQTGSFVSDRPDQRLEHLPAFEKRDDQPQSTCASGPAIADYQIVWEIGRGGMGVVFEAIEERLNRRVALKVLPANALADLKAVNRFEREAKAAAGLHHTNIVPVFGVGQDGGHHYYVMQFIDGFGLDAVLAEQRRLRQDRLDARRGAAADATQATNRHEPRAAAQPHAKPVNSPAAIARSLSNGRFAGPAPRDADPDATEVRSSDTAPIAPQPVRATQSAPVRSGSSDLAAISSTDRGYYRSVARIGLLVAEALEYANRQGVLHRDIKPSNLLLDTSGNVWVTDFGLAKTADADDLTQSGDILGTLRYMASERFLGNCDARSDVYSLGLTLYELIALRPAFEGADRFDLIDRIRHEEPTRLKKLVPSVPRDLETIIHKASALESSARYRSAAALADDLRLFIEDRPIAARRISTSERCLRWCRRNKGVAAVLGFLFLVLVAWTATATVLWQRAKADRDRADDLYIQSETRRRESDHLRGVAEKRRITAEANQKEAETQTALAKLGFGKANDAVDEFLNKVTENQLLTVPGLQPLRRDLLNSALGFYQEFLDTRSGNPALRSSLAGAYFRVGVIQSELGAENDARQALLSARSIYETLASANPNDNSAQEGLANCLVRQSSFADAIAVWEKLTKAQRNNRVYARNLAHAYNELGKSQSDEAQNDQRKVADALQSHQKALVLRQELARALPDDARARSDVGASLNNIGALLLKTGNIAGALEVFLRSVEHGDAAVAKLPQVVTYAQFLGTTYRNVTRTLQDLGRRNEALLWYDKLVEHWRRRAWENPEVPLFAAGLYMDLNFQAQLLFEVGRTADSAKAMREAAVVIERLPAKTSVDLYNLACVRASIARYIDPNRNKLTAAEEGERERMANSAMDALTRAVADTTRDWSYLERDPDLDALRGRADFHVLVKQLRRFGNRASTTITAQFDRTPQEKLREQQEKLSESDRLARENPTSRWNRVDVAASQLAIGRLLTDLKHYDEAEAMLKKSQAIYESLRRDYPNSVRYRLDAASAQLALASLHWLTLQLNQANRERTSALDAMASGLRAEPKESSLRVELDVARLDAADRLLKAGLWGEAAPLYELVYRREPTTLMRISGLPWSTHAVLRFLVGDTTGYRDSCAKLAEQFKMVSTTKFNLYRACTAGPGAVDDLPALAAMAEAEAVATSYDNWQVLLAALICARAGQYAKAQSYFDRIPPNFQQASYIEPGRAIVQYHLGHHDRARQLLEQGDRFAEDTFRRALAAPVQPAAFPYAEVNLMVEALRRDAHILIEGKPPADIPWRQLFRGRLLAKMGRGLEAEACIAAALALRPNDRQLRVDHARVIAELARESPNNAESTGMVTLLDRSLAKFPNDPDLLKSRAEISAARGHWDKAAADLNRFLAARPEISPKCFVTGCWVSGPFPFQPGPPAMPIPLERLLPSGPEPDPLQPAVLPDGTRAVPWRPLTLGGSGYINLEPLMQPSDYSSAFVLARVYAPTDLQTVLLNGCDDGLTLWINGRLISKQPLHYQDTAIPVSLRAGWNTVLTRVDNLIMGFMIRLRFSDNPTEIARAFGVYLDQNRWSAQTAEVLAGLYRALPPNPAAWAPRAGLDTEVVRREDIFPRAVAQRPNDTQLWLARGRYLAWLGRWDTTRAAYDRVIHKRTNLEDAHDEYASVLLLDGDQAAYRAWCERLRKQFEQRPSNYTAFLLARAAVLAPNTCDDPSCLVRWAERGAKDQPKAPHVLYVQGLAYLRAGRLNESVQYFHASLTDSRHWLDISNWLGLALAHHHLGHAAEARSWLEKVRKWIDGQQRERANNAVHFTPPLLVTDWVEVLVLRREAETLILYDPAFPVDPFVGSHLRDAR
jgi:serine/threonine protein kinase/tetratricopeptide (TPR) repeat protein